MELNKKISVQVPSVPNFLLSNGETKYDIAVMSERDLKKIARAWSEKLLENAARRRKNIIEAVISTI